MLTKHIHNMLRKKYLIWFKGDYVKINLAARKGECFACGVCCRQIVPFCPFLTRDNKCRLIKWFNWQPKFCKVFPLDEIDQYLCNIRGKCGYHWGGRLADG